MDKNSGHQEVIKENNKNQQRYSFKPNVFFMNFSKIYNSRKGLLNSLFNFTLSYDL